MSEVPYFLWSSGDELPADELRRRLRSDDPAERSLWASRVLREARFSEVWDYVALDDVIRDWPLIARNLGRKRAYWQWILDSWRRDGLLAP